jgi:hypothetical protein
MGVVTGDERTAQMEKAKAVPHIVNLHEDPALSRQLMYFFDEGARGPTCVFVFAWALSRVSVGVQCAVGLPCRREGRRAGRGAPSTTSVATLALGSVCLAPHACLHSPPHPHPHPHPPPPRETLYPIAGCVPRPRPPCVVCLAHCSKRAHAPGSTLRFGREDAPEEQHVRLAGLNIEAQHAFVTTTAEGITIARATEGARVTLNGEPLVDGAQLRHNDRLIFGNNHVYLVRVCGLEGGLVGGRG